MVRIRLARKGRIYKPFYHIVIADSRSRRDGRFIEKIGYYDPIRKEVFKLDLDRFNYWVSKGAQASDVVNRLHKKASAGSAENR